MNPIKTYYNGLAAQLAANFAIAGSGGHASDTGTNREYLVRDFLNKHLASRLKASLGGRIIGLDQPISAQIDVVVKSDLTPKFEENEKSFFLIESIVSATSVKSYLSKDSLFDALLNISTIPQFNPNTLSFMNINSNMYAEYEKFYPRLFIFAFDGISCENAVKHTIAFYEQNPQIPDNRKPLGIIVNGQYAIRYTPIGAETFDRIPIPPGVFYGYLLPEDFLGYPLADMINSISSCLGWLPWMQVHPHVYFNTGYRESL